MALAGTTHGKGSASPARRTRFSILIRQIFVVLLKRRGFDDERVMVLQSDGVP